MNFAVICILIDGAELLLDLGCSPSLIGKCKIMIRIYKKETELQYIVRSVRMISLCSEGRIPFC